MELALLILLLAFGVSLLSGLLGIGGGILMAPLLLYLPAALALGELSMADVTGLTITQGLFASASGALRHGRSNMVNRRLVLWMGGSIFAGALVGSLLSSAFADRALMVLFAMMASLAALLMLLPKRAGADEVGGAADCSFNAPLASALALGVGLLGGMVGQGGSFLLIPLMLQVLRLPTRVAIGSNLAIVFLASMAGFAGKFATGQVPLLLAAGLVIGAVTGAQVGSIVSLRTRPGWLRLVMAVVVTVMAIGVGVRAIAAQ